MRTNKDVKSLSKKRILICGSAPSVKGGISTVIDQLLNYNWTDDYIIKFIPSHIDGCVFKKILFFIKAYCNILFSIFKNTFDIIHIHMSYKGSFYRKYYIAKLCKKYNKKVVIHLHGSEFKDFYNDGTDRLKGQIYELFAMVDVCIVLGESWKDFILSIVPDSHVEIVNNAIAIPDVPLKFVQPIRTFLFLGTLIERKGCIDLLYAVKALIDSGVIDFHLFIAGTGVEEDRLKYFVSTNRLEKYVTFLGWIDKSQQRNLFLKSDILVLPSYNEGLPMAILEAMSYRLPIISTDVGSISEAVKNNVSGFLINPGNVKALKESMNIYIKSSEKWMAASCASRQIAEDLFSDEIFFNKIKKIYQDL